MFSRINQGGSHVFQDGSGGSHVFQEGLEMITFFQYESRYHIFSRRIGKDHMFFRMNQEVYPMEGIRRKHSFSENQEISPIFQEESERITCFLGWIGDYGCSF
ncbi:hypothetical protein CEXT_433751 [Caerostris extrusa]|uniref:Maturase K n=1 Tax=Caerostris extrusa TaxID=172846 RepID=A0AAV4TLK5_CAEEX|nr:hypothetical protein CEXT_433751 [Caerostris extrusa]